jgi:NACalpha-BTF3-like transcription factor
MMNEKIKDLMTEAGISVEYVTNTKQIVILEKFAELIVRECGVALSPMLRDMISRGQAYDSIKEHFGVEE